jgi:hypothetical protein
MVPKAKYLTALVAGLSCVVLGIVYWVLIGSHNGQDYLGVWLMLGSYAVGIGLAFACLRWIFLRRSILKGPLPNRWLIPALWLIGATVYSVIIVTWILAYQWSLSHGQPGK